MYEERRGTYFLKLKTAEAHTMPRLISGRKRPEINLETRALDGRMRNSKQQKPIQCPD